MDNYHNSSDSRSQSVKPYSPLSCVTMPLRRWTISLLFSLSCRPASSRFNKKSRKSAAEFISSIPELWSHRGQTNCNKLSNSLFNKTMRDICQLSCYLIKMKNKKLYLHLHQIFSLMSTGKQSCQHPLQIRFVMDCFFLF